MRPEAQAVLEAANDCEAGTFDNRLRDAINVLFDLDDSERREIVRDIGRGIIELESPVGAGLLAVWFGGGVEQGRDPTPTTPILLETLLAWCRRVETTEDGEPIGELSEAISTGTELLGQGLVAHLTRARELRDEYAQNAEILEELDRVDHLLVGPTWVLEVLLRRSGELVVIHATEHVGVRVRYEEIGNCFHLFTLLQGAAASFLPGAETPDPRVLAAARGEPSGELSDSAWWHYGQAFANEPDLTSMVFGEASPDSLEVIEGERVMLVWPPVMDGRSWSDGFFGPPIASSQPAVRVLGELSPTEIATWVERLSLPRQDEG